MQAAPQKVPFWKATWFIVLMLIFFFPLGVILLWAVGKPNQTAKIIMTAVFGLMFLIIVIPKGDAQTPASASASPAVSAALQASSEATEAPTATPTPEPTPTPTPEPTPTPFDPSTIETIKKTGKGDDVISLEATKVWVYRCVATHSGKSNFVVKADGELIINEIGKYNGSFPLSYDTLDAKEIEIEADGAWTLTLEPVLYTDTSEMSGNGSYVSDAFAMEDPGIYEITHKGKSNFVIYIHGTSSGSDLLINEIGNYSGKKKVNIPAGEIAFWQVEADGAWSIKKSSSN